MRFEVSNKAFEAIDAHNWGLETQNGGVEARNGAVEGLYPSHIDDEQNPDPHQSEKSDSDPYKVKSGFESLHIA